MKAPLPVFIPFPRLMEQRSRKENNYLAQRVVEYYVFKDFNTFLQKGKVREILEDRRNYTQELPGEADLNMLKSYVLSEQNIHHLAIQENYLRTQWTYIRRVISKRFYDIFAKLSSISIDGFKRERYVIKI